MGTTSSVTTGGVVVSAASLVPAVDWVMSGCHGPVPASVSALVAGVLAMAIHAGYAYVSSRQGMPAIALPPGTQVTYTPPVTVLSTSAPTTVTKE